MTTPTRAADVLVTSASEIAAALGSLQPGDTLVMRDGVWTNQSIALAGIGTSVAPITLRPETPGGVKLTGSSKLTISGDWLVVEGLRFEDGALNENEHIVRFQGALGEATNSRFTNSTIINYNPASTSTRYFWVSLEGNSNRVDHNYFSGQNHSGVTVSVVRDSNEADYHRIDNNYFADRLPGNGNGFETIRIGTSDFSISDSYTTVENNVFERVDGEIEIVSNKSGSNTMRYNTFRASSGTLTLRHGNDATVEGNFFLGQGKSGSGGVRVIGERQTIINNYFQGLDGRAGGAISLSAGVPNSQVFEYVQVRDALIANNTIVDVNAAAITFDDGLGSSGRTLLPENVTIANNLIWSTQDPLFEGAQGTGWTWQNNLAFGQSLGSAAGQSGIVVADPQLTIGPDGLWRLSPTSPAIDAGTNAHSSILTTDFDGQARIGLPDIGADELSIAAIVRKPLSASDVGPAWLGAAVPTVGCGPTGCVLQAEAFSSILDPDADGAFWTVEPVGTALGGQVLKAPAGDRIDLPAETHDTIATYDVMFETAGVYTAYLRARGFSGSSDSLYTPAAFDTDPSTVETVTNDGTFRWETLPVTFAIGAAHVGMPLEFRLAMREQLLEIDALVITLDPTLTATQLDALFTVVPGDYNADGLVDVADYTLWRDTLGQVGVGLPADGDGSGVVDDRDRLYWALAYAGAGSAAIPEPAALWLVSVVTLCGTVLRQRA
ncbi:Chondroitinase-B precursor [Botrimarina hoheduenensis]|uniref:Chondroitinase-B n=2 Tax=Botrimarina hoheduenensis TaxID=2528000 RepID=A0A5C5W7J2_9BACT|nr:Chondroitinase-B precursor [Botrimarina hoheduenensis]